ncbi:Predicted ATPase [Chitinophaga sp. YR627]|uniref:AAA family ATPase n=1 Tax=Chitinophaga sp. YR627 TaxID=1881041 RepID=UPI0008E0541F|nr:AAA family ATPase [Chitinophaga sp. YR627]SFN19527.1 Predicted ATPase [Chitinophaga sp. YR627]
MSRIRIKNFGPIKEGNTENDGWIDIKKVTMFIGNQGSGKSTVAKLISTFVWMEKALVRGVGDYNKKWFEEKNRLHDFFLGYHNIESYLNVHSVIEYDGEAYSILYNNSFLHVHQKEGTTYHLPQIMYVPAERNFIAYVKTPKELRLSSASLQEFLTEFENAKAEMKGPIQLPINNASVEYDRLNDILNLRDNDYIIKLNEASSGFQSLVPLYLVADYLSRSVKGDSESHEPMNDEERQQFKIDFEEIWNNRALTNEQKRIAVSALSTRFNKTAFINIVEEPEQNLFPSSQWEMLQSLLKCNNMNADNKLIVTSHSPYVINYLNIAIQGDELLQKIREAKKEDILLPELFKVIPQTALVSANDVVVYELDETRGGVKKLPAPEGIPSDKNYLNNMLRAGNNIFDTLLSIEEEL